MGNYNSYMYDMGEDIDMEPVTAECHVHFRPKADWNGQDYGFDWMRIKAPKPLGDNFSYEGLVSKQHNLDGKLTTDPNQYNGMFREDPAQYANLEKDYCRLTVAWQRDANDKCYYPSWLSMYPPSPMPDSKHLSVGEVQLRLFLDVGKAPDRLEFEENEYFEIIPKVIDSDFREGKSYCWQDGKETITVKCKKSSSFFQTIKVYAVKKNKITGDDDKYLAGRLRIWPNSAGRLKHLKVLLVHVTTPAESAPVLLMMKPQKAQAQPAYSTYSTLDGSGTVYVTGKIVPLPTGPKAATAKPAVTKKKNDDPQGDSKNQRELIDRYLRQALISANVLVEELDLSEDVNFKYGGCYRHKSGILGYYAPIYGKGDPVDNPQKPKGFEDVEKYLYKKLQQILKVEGKDPNLYADYKRVFFFGEPGGCIEGATGNELSSNVKGYSPADHNNIVMFPNYADAAVVHEILHSLGLAHTFTNFKADPNAKFTYRSQFTDNLMDYSSNVYALWHWQWEIANGNVK